MPTTTLNADLGLSILNTTQDVENVLYIEDETKQGDSLELTLENSGSGDIALFSSTANASASTYTFYLKFQAGALKKETLFQVRDWNAATSKWEVNPGRWSQFAYIDPTDHSLTIYFVSKDAVTLAKNLGHSIMVVLRDARPDTDVSMPADVELRIRKTDLNEEYCQTYLNIVSHKGARDIPIRVDVKGAQAGAQLLINQESDLILKLFNTGQTDIDFSNARIELTWIADTAKSYALTTPSEAPAQGNVTIFGKGVTQNVEGTNPIYTLDPENPPNSSLILSPGNQLKISITNLITSLPPGIAILYINYYDVDGYWDGILEVPLARTQLVQSKDLHVGIGTNTPKYQLDFGKTLLENDEKLALYGTSDKLYGFGITQNRLNIFASDKTNPRIVIKDDGNVGIGTDTPKYLLDFGTTLSDYDKKLALYGTSDKLYGFGITQNRLNIFANDQITPKMVIKGEDGKVGIGTTSPDAALSVIGTVRGAFEDTETNYVEMGHGGSNGYINRVGTGRLDFRIGGSNKISIDSNGNVGIGAPLPYCKLDVDGDIKCSGSITIGQTTLTEAQLETLVKLCQGTLAIKLYTPNYEGRYIYISGATRSSADDNHYILASKDDQENYDGVNNRTVFTIEPQ